MAFPRVAGFCSLVILAMMMMSLNQTKANEDGRQLIRNGKDVSPLDYPYVVELLKGNSNNKDASTLVSTCGGTLVASDMILTAGHCIESSPKQIRKRLTPSDDETIVDLQRALLHPDFKDDDAEEETNDQHHHGYQYIQHDVMLLVLKEEATGIEESSLALINMDNTIPENNGTVLSSLGYGHISEDGTPPHPRPETLQLLESTYEPNSDCFWDNVHETAVTSTDGEEEPDGGTGGIQWMDSWLDSYLCTKSDIGMGHCGGDSGGPVMALTASSEQPNLQVGIMSLGIEPCGTTDNDAAAAAALLPDVNARVSTHAPWIRQQICAYAKNPPSYLDCTKEEMKEATSKRPKEHPVEPLQHAASAIATVTLTIVHDMYASELSWSFTDNETGFVVAASKPYENEQEIVESITLLYQHPYTFHIQDSMGDGICCTNGRSGHYRLVDDATGTRVLDSKGDYGFERKEEEVIVTGEPTIQLTGAVLAVILLNVAIIVFCLSCVLVVGCSERTKNRRGQEQVYGGGHM